MKFDLIGKVKKTLEDFDFSFQPSIDKRQIDELATLRFVENAENVVFSGPPGVGKTHLANALGMVAVKNRYSTYYINCHTLIDQLKKVIMRIGCQANTKYSSGEYVGGILHPEPDGLYTSVAEI